MHVIFNEEETDVVMGRTPDHIKCLEFGNKFNQI